MANYIDIFYEGWLIAVTGSFDKAFTGFTILKLRLFCL